jgi:hypothetical protein
MLGFTEIQVKVGMERNTCGGTSYFVDIAWCCKANKIEENTRTVSMEIRRKGTQHAIGIFIGQNPLGTTTVFIDSNRACSGCGPASSDGHASQ